MFGAIYVKENLGLVGLWVQGDSVLENIFSKIIWITCGFLKLHNILEPMLGWPSKNKTKNNSDSKNLVESLEPKLHVSLKWKKHTCGSGGVSITT